jgi:hypothetical protein
VRRYARFTGDEERIMSVLVELFAGTHAEAIARADALDAGGTPPPARHLEMTAITPLDLEQLGEIAARAVKFGNGDLELAEVDLDHELLFRLPDFLCEVLVALGADEDPDLLGEVAEEWGATEELAAPAADLAPVLREIVELVTAALDDDLGVYLWAETL